MANCPGSGYPYCDRCGQVMELIEDCGGGVQIFACGYCDLGGKEHSEPIIYGRTFTCFHCSLYQTVGEERRSKTPNMGHHCLRCGKDLTEYFQSIYRMRELNAKSGRIDTYA